MILDELLKQIFLFLHNIIGNYGLSIIALSLTVFVIMLPLFWIAEKLRYKELTRKAEMQTLLNEIEAVQNKQEKYYYTKEIYKKYNYKAYYSLIGLIGLLIQIPFFLAAYWMLSDFNAFDGQAFGPIHNLLKPDALLSIGLLKINILPLLMTIVNLIAIYFERERLTIQEIKQLVGSAILFLIVLYSFSSALVLYWTANNFFSIFRNKLIGSNRKIVLYDSIRLKLNLDLIKENVYKHEKEILNILGILAGYFFFVHLELTVLMWKNPPNYIGVASRVFLLLNLSIISTLYFLNSIFKRGISKQTSLLLIITFLSSFSLMSGFVRRLIGISLIEVLIIIYLIILFGCIFLIYNFRKTQLKQTEKLVFFMPKSIYSLFLSLSIPLTVYLQSNLEYFTIQSGIIYYILMIGFPILIFKVIWYFFQKGINKNIFVPSFVGATLTFYLVPLITDFTLLNSETNFIAHTILLLFMICIFILLFNRDKKILPFLTLSILLILVFQKAYVSNFESKEVGLKSEIEVENKAELFFKNKEMIHKPDIYLLIYDSYVEVDQMRKLYKINNNKQMKYLESQNFEFYKNVYSTGRASLETMSNVLNLSNVFDGIFEYRKRISGESTLNHILQKNGYITHNIVNPYITRDSKQTVDYSYPKTDYGMFSIVKAIFIGEFKINLEKGYNMWIEKKNEILQKNNDKPIFLYAHSPYPSHSQSSGSLLSNENMLYEKRLKIANNEMKNDLSQIIGNGRESIIIIAGDHGPHLTASGFKLVGYEEEDITLNHIKDRYGVFLAIRYPDSWEKTYGNKIEVLQEVFVNVLSNMYEVQPPKNLVGKKSSSLNDQITTPTIIDGIIQIGKNKGERLYK